MPDKVKETIVDEIMPGLTFSKFPKSSRMTQEFGTEDQYMAHQTSLVDVEKCLLVDC